jgi:hypothetical protein
MNKQLIINFSKDFMRPHIVKHAKADDKESLIDNINDMFKKLDTSLYIYKEEAKKHFSELLFFNAADEREVNRGASYAVTDSLLQAAQNGGITIQRVRRALTHEGIGDPKKQDFIIALLLQNRIGWNVFFGKTVNGILLGLSDGAPISLPREGNNFTLRYVKADDSVIITTYANISYFNNDHNVVIGSVSSKLKVCADNTVTLENAQIVLNRPDNDQAIANLYDTIAANGAKAGLFAASYADRQEFVISPVPIGFIQRAYMTLKAWFSQIAYWFNKPLAKLKCQTNNKVDAIIKEPAKQDKTNVTSKVTGFKNTLFAHSSTAEFSVDDDNQDIKENQNKLKQ